MSGKIFHIPPSKELPYHPKHLPLIMELPGKPPEIFNKPFHPTFFKYDFKYVQLSTCSDL
jgi:hypothetical protein